MKMTDQGSSDFLLPAVAYVPPPKVTRVNVVASTGLNGNLVVGLVFPAFICRPGPYISYNLTLNGGRKC